MARISPFPALRPVDAAATSCPPYDVVTTDEAKALAGPTSFLHVIKAEIDGDPYEMARENLARFRTDGILIQDAEPGVYLYRVGPQTGLVCCYDVNDYRQGVVKKHEKTRPDKEEDRTRHMRALSAHAGPLFCMYRDVPALTALQEKDARNGPLFDFAAPDGVRHTGWRVPDAKPYIDAFAPLDLYIADGHHRAASASNVAEGGESDRVLCVLFPASQLTVIAYNRVVLEAPAGLKDRLSLTPTDNPVPDRPGVVCVWLDGWYRLELKGEGLDCARLQEQVLEPLLGIADVRTDPRIEFVGGVKGTDALK